MMNGLIDYAGLFPPASLSMAKAVRQFAQHRRGKQAFALARFICPLTRLDEWSEAARAHLSSGHVPASEAAPDPWGLSVLLDVPLDQALASIERFNEAHAAGEGGSHKHAHTAVIDTVEIKVQTPEVIEKAMDKLPEDLFPFFEVPADGDFRSFAAALAGTGFGAKLRTGGVVAEAIPSCERVAEFLEVFAAAEVPIKCTAGLHHPVRGEQRLTYQDNSPRAVMHGFLNVFMGAAFVHALQADRQTVLNVLRETDPGAFHFDDASAGWRSLRLTVQQLEEAREVFAICFGSCSFEEPTTEVGLRA